MWALRRRYGRSVSPKPLKVYGVLAGAYKGRNVSERALLTHYGRPDDKETALCGKVKPGMLGDMEEEGPPTCQACLRKGIEFGR